MSMYHFQCIAPILAAFAVCFGLYLYATFKGWL